MKLTLLRQPSIQAATMGKLYIDGVLACHTLEDEVRELPGVPVNEWKIKGATAIPAGVYAVTLETSNRFGENTPTINDVPGFSYIRMHAGNTAADTEGCLLLGMRATDHTLIGGTSKPAVELVRNAIIKAQSSHEIITIDISNSEAFA